MKRFTLVAFAILCLSVFFLTTTNSTPINTFNTLNHTTVSFTFDGLQLLAFGNPDRVTDGILDVHHHTPRLEITKIEKGKEKLIVSFEGKDLYKKVLNITLPKNSFKQNNSTNSLKPTRYYSTDMNKDTKDFRWCLDMESDLFQKQLYLNENKLFTKIHFNTGTFFTSELLNGKYQFVAGSKVHSLNRQIGAPGAKIQLQANEVLAINGLSKNIEFHYQLGVNYTVSISNLPPKEMANIDHFGFYYDIFKNQQVTRFMPIAVSKSSFTPRPFLCEAVVLGQSAID